jgi:hypothetical protein
VSRLILKPTFQLEGTDPSTDYDVHYSSSSGILTIGCQEHTLAVWKRDGAELVAGRMAGYSIGAGCGCAGCLRAQKRVEQRRAAAVRRYLPRLTRLIEHIENAEAALKSSLRAQTKRA